jgi:hypothetical protein
MDDQEIEVRVNMNNQISRLQIERGLLLNTLVKAATGQMNIGQIKGWLQEKYPEVCPVCGADGQKGRLCFRCGVRLRDEPLSDLDKDVCGSCGESSKGGNLCPKCRAAFE